MIAKLSLILMALGAFIFIYASVGLATTGYQIFLNHNQTLETGK